MDSKASADCSVPGCGRRGNRRCGHCERLLCEECWCPKDVDETRSRREAVVSYAHKAYYPPTPEDVRARQ